MVAKTQVVINRMKILAGLRQAGSGFVSGQKFCELIGVSRETVSKYVSYFNHNGYVIKSRPRVGYRLDANPDALLPEEIALHLDHGLIPDFIYFKQVSSTNDIAKQHDIGEHGLLVVGEQQASGKGRRGSNWFSPPGGIWMSAALHCDIDVSFAPWLSLGMAVEAAGVLRGMYGIDAKVKWPNDILVSDRKLAGILIESVIEGSVVTRMVAGIGINANNKAGEVPPNLRQVITSLQELTGGHIDRSACAAKVLESMIKTVTAIQSGRVDNYRLAWKKYDALYGKNVTVLCERQDTVHGRVMGIDNSGRLKLKTHDGIVLVSAGHVCAVEDG